jgi:hypothetical protein
MEMVTQRSAFLQIVAFQKVPSHRKLKSWKDDSPPQVTVRSFNNRARRRYSCVLSFGLDPKLLDQPAACDDTKLDTSRPMDLRML